MRKNVFVLGLDELNLETLQALPDADRYAFHQLFTFEELQGREDIPLAELIEEGTRALEAFEGSVDAIVGYWDFPVSSMVPILAQRFGVCSSSLESRLKCEHKYWARLEQSKVIEEYPRFTVVDPFDDDDVAAIDLRYPYWLKPVKSFSSELAMEVNDADDLKQAIVEIRDGIGRVGKPFEYVLSQVEELPVEIADLGGQVCIAEEAVTGQLCTVEGFRLGDEVVVYGLFDSVPYPDTPSFLRFEYPSQVPEHLQDQMRTVCERVVRQVDLDHSTFNVEFFWDDDGVTVLEVNPRHSQSHAPLLYDVDGLANHALMLDLALEQPPRVPRGEGPYECAAKWFLRVFREDGVLARVPTEPEVRAIEDRIEGTRIKLLVSTGDRLSEQHDQDSYSYKLAEVFVGAADSDQLRARYEQCVDALQFAFE